MTDRKIYTDLELVENVITWQGEGAFTGEICLMLRFKKCNLHCKFCDTQPRTSGIIAHRCKFEELVKQSKHCNNNFILTGGEPTLYSDQIIDFIKYLSDLKIDYKITVETNGFQLKYLDDQLKEILSLDEKSKRIFYHFSPKFFDSDAGIKATMKIVKDVYQSNLILKIVAYDIDKQYSYTKKLLSELKDYKEKGISIFLMPESQVATEVLLRMPDLFPIAREFGCNISSRMHLIHDFY